MTFEFTGKQENISTAHFVAQVGLSQMSEKINIRATQLGRQSPAGLFVLPASGNPEFHLRPACRLPDHQIDALIRTEGPRKKNRQALPRFVVPRLRSKIVTPIDSVVDCVG